MESQNKASSTSINVDEYSSLTSNNENPQNTATLTNLTPDQISALNAHLPNEINIETITSTLTTNNENEVNPLVPSSISNTLDTLTFYQLILIIISIVNFCRKKSQTYNKNFEEKFNLASVQSSNATQQENSNQNKEINEVKESSQTQPPVTPQETSKKNRIKTLVYVATTILSFLLDKILYLTLNGYYI
ncbi:hypothetical protein PFTANZ_00997 [Plasmodium falciparum Tanzania (2000708)]|uniref:Uncharacterized protein n=1 Tax=Plasmodium falciparum Tanzania (2000708) TaxID=1036725 RepID=A0A024WD00_PLAFA|nr:hypothetical protein PFTANZ_00997 [Plasmodium falciparum Tanzania (2000708)]